MVVAVNIAGKYRLGLGAGCAPSLPGMAHILGEDGAHPGRGSGKPFAGMLSGLGKDCAKWLLSPEKIS